MPIPPNEAATRLPSASASQEPQLGRRFGYWSGHFVVVASMIGAGILTTSGYTLRATENPAALLALWCVGGIMALAGALTVAELATTFPEVGGDYLFVREGFGPSAGFVAGWATFLLGFTAPTAVVALISSSYLLAPHAGVFETQASPWLAANNNRLLASVLIVIATLVHCWGHRESARFQIVITILKLSILTLLAVAGLAVGHGSWQPLIESRWPSGSQWPALATGLIYVGYSYSGWNGAAYLAGEIRDPARLLPRCLIWGTLSVMAIYLLVNLTYVYALDPALLRGLPPGAEANVAELAMNQLFGANVGGVIATLLGVGLIASLGAFLMIGPRVAVAMANAGVFPHFAGRYHSRRQVPMAATLVQGSLAFFAGLVGLVSGNPRLHLRRLGRHLWADDCQHFSHPPPAGRLAGELARVRTQSGISTRGAR